jgi:hypothetical protein
LAGFYTGNTFLLRHRPAHHTDAEARDDGWIDLGECKWDAMRWHGLEDLYAAPPAPPASSEHPRTTAAAGAQILI